MMNSDTLKPIELCLTPGAYSPLHQYEQLGIHLRKNRTKFYNLNSSSGPELGSIFMFEIWVTKLWPS